ncbi:sugar ABC transporter substrate-binding protein [Streptomyces montanisoli]|uniref:Substrate-binding domain-containing protein n=1 Tax=Streptomyces montanisoli TaxID=2798581 RepID=A0A940M9D0_9ACTN|nr:substrate-binding domain-containing protein [Streptomyces montanisoli]MBP0456737.1 substrate-binding domain-containing protein [Streptomyces montanisoli]
MNAQMRRAAMAASATAMAVLLAACGSAKQSGGSGGGDSASKKAKGDDITVGLLLPENKTARYESLDRPLITKRISDLTNGKGKVVYENAQQDATTQTQQMQTLITRKVDVIILDSVDSKSIASSVQKAKDAGIPVVAYDRLADGPIDAYTSFDNTEVGRVQANALVKKLGPKAKSGKIVMVNGSVTDPNAKMFKDGALPILQKATTIAKKYDTPDWDPNNANSEMAAAIQAVGKNNIVGVYSANDDMAGAIIQAMKTAGMDPKKIPVTGQDSTLTGVQRILAGTQFMSIFKSYPQEASIAGQMAVDLAQGKSVDSVAPDKSNSNTTKNIPTKIVPVVALTKDNIKDTVVKDNYYKLSDICTANYKAACKAAGLM